MNVSELYQLKSDFLIKEVELLREAISAKGGKVVFSDKERGYPKILAYLYKGDVESFWITKVEIEDNEAVSVYGYTEYGDESEADWIDIDDILFGELLYLTDEYILS